MASLWVYITGEPKKENIMRKIMLLGVSSLFIVCSAFDADARSSDEEDSPQASTQPGYTLPHHNSSMQDRRFALRPMDGLEEE
jgi:hypothetical protein